MDWGGAIGAHTSRQEKVPIQGGTMPEKRTRVRARKQLRRGKAPTTAAGEFVREEIHHVRQGKHGARSPQQAIAIGLSKARRAGVKLPRPPRGTASAAKENRRHRSTRKTRGSSRRRSQARSRALRREGRSAASHRALSRQARQASRRRTAGSRSQAARRAARTRRGRRS